MLVYTCDPNTLEDTGGPEVLGHAWSHSYANLRYMAPCLKQKAINLLYYITVEFSEKLTLC